MDYALNIKHFSVVEYIHRLKQAKFTDEQAEVVAEILEQQSQVFNEYNSRVHNLELKEPATKKDLEITKLDLQKEIEIVWREIEVVHREIEVVRRDTLKFIIWTGVSVTFTLLVSLGGMMAKGFGWL